MRAFRLIILLFFSYGLLQAQSSLLKIKTREVILTVKDTVIKINVLTGQTKIEPNPGRVYFWYLKGKVNSNTGGFTGILLHGPYEVTIDDKLRTSGQFERGLKTGIWKLWSGKGNLLEITSWNDGVRDGEHMIIIENGERIKCDIYKNGHLTKTRDAREIGSLQQWVTKNLSSK